MKPTFLHRRLFTEVAGRPSPLRWIVLTTFFLSLGAVLAPVHADAADDVWVAIRADGRTGVGTADDPYDGSTVGRFDALMGRSGSLTHRACRIHLGPGKFVTRGLSLALDSQLLGSGMDRTVIQLKSGTARPGQKTAVMQINDTGGVGADTTTVSDLTVDGNIAGQPHAPHDICVSEGVVASRISRVKAIGLGTSRPPGATALESFWIGTDTGAQNAAGVPSYNQVIEDSICVAPTTPMSVTFFDCSGGNSTAEGPSDVATRNVIVRNCKVVCTTPGGTFDGHAFTFANCDSGIVEDCYTDGISCGYYQDTWSARKIAIRNNVFSRVTFGVFFNGPSSSVMDGLTVDGNLFDLMPNHNGPENGNGVRLYGTNARFVSITDNRIRIAPGLTTAGATNGGIELKSGPTPYTQMNATVRDNCIDTEPPENRLITQGGMKAITADFENNGDSYGEDVLGSRYERLTFTTAGTGWYGLWTQTLSVRAGAGMTGLVTVRTRALLGSGSVTLSGGSAHVALPAVTPDSRVVLRLATATGVPGAAVYPTLRPGNGFVVQSTNARDRSTYTYTVDGGSESNACCFTVSNPPPPGLPVLTQLYAGSPAANRTETSCTQVKAYAAGSSQSLWGNISGPSIVTVDIVPGTDLAPLEDPDGPVGLRENGTAGPGANPVALLTLNPVAGLVSTAPILAPNLPGAGNAAGNHAPAKR